MQATEEYAGGRWRRDLSLLDDLEVAAVAVDELGLVTYCNTSAATRFRRRPGALLGTNGLELLFSPSRAGTAQEIHARVLGGSSWTGEMAVLGPDGAERVIGISWSPLRANAVADGALILLEESTGDAAHARRLANRLQRLAAVTSELLAATDVEAITDVVVHQIADAADATVSSLSVLIDDETLALVGIDGGPGGAASRWATYPVDAATPAGEACRDGRTITITGTDDLRQRYPGLELATEGERSMICLPLRVAHRSIGVISLSFPGRRTFEPAELEFFGLLADTCAQALERSRVLAEVADREAKLQFLADASIELASSLDYEATLKAVAHLAVPQFADWCVIQLLQDGVLRPLAMAHPDVLLESRVLELQEKYPPDPGARRGAYQVVRSGASELVPDITDAMLVLAARDEAHLDVLRELNFRSALQVPLKIRDNVLGVITWVTGNDGRRFTSGDLSFGEDLAHRAAVAIDNSHLHSQVRDVAIRLQRAVLPDQPPSVRGWDVAVRYLPAGRTDVGGDFYDVVELHDGRVVTFIGDVMGRGVPAAAAMAQMRSAVRTLIAVDPDPDFVMAGLDRLFEQYELDRLVTLAYAVADPRQDLLQVINAGHPAPVFRHADGRLRDISTEDSLILGAGGGKRAVVTCQFKRGDTLLMFTDGLVERRAESLAEGQVRVHEAARHLVDPDLGKGLFTLVDTVRDATRDDDVAAVALRRARP
ncbi:MAG: putative regulatory protein [Marmoricola sp.]|jgi:GAF domain-containing protein|nr:putative regulatory protein [Marmoricola sp.]